MSLKIYCSKGHPTEYTLTKPKFCSECSEAFEKSFASTASPSRQPITNKPRRPVQIEVEEEPENIPEIDSLAVEVSVPNKRGLKIEEILGTRDPQSPIDSRPKRNVSDEQILKEFRTEGSNSGKSTEVGE